MNRVIRRLFGWRRLMVALDTPPTKLASRFRAAGLSANSAEMDDFRATVLNAPELRENVDAVVLRPEDLDPGSGLRDAVEALRDSDVLLGIRADTGWEPITSPADLVTSGLDNLRERLTCIRDRGAHLALWSVCTTTAAEGLVSLTVNSQAAARFARTCQSVGLVPIIRVGGRIEHRPAVDRRGVLAAALLSVTGHLADLDVDLGAVVINPTCEPDADLDPHGRGVLDALPIGLGGLAVGASRPDATVPPAPDSSLVDLALACRPTWPVTLYLGREVTVPALRAWRGQAVHVRACQRALGSELIAFAHLMREGAQVTKR